jgi:hypothetical protein
MLGWVENQPDINFRVPDFPLLRATFFLGTKKNHTPGRRATSNDADLGLGIQYTRRHPTEFPGSWKAVEMGKVREHMGFIKTWDVIPPQSIKT